MMSPLISRRCLIVSVALIGATLLIISGLAPDFRFGTTTPDHPWALFTVTLMIASVIWMALIPCLKAIKAAPLGSYSLVAFLGMALLYRAISFGDVSIYEDDWARYLWDGAVAAQGENPYAHSPAAILQEPDHALYPQDPASQATLKRVNNPNLSTIYPPTATAAFSLAHQIKPFDLDALRGVYLLSEALSFLLMMCALHRWGKAPQWVLLYAFNPLLIMTGFNAAHMDILLTPFLMVALIMAAPSQSSSRPSLWRIMGIALSLALAVGVKVWPLILAPILFRPWRKHKFAYVGAGILTAGLAALILWPIIAQLSPDSGLQAYSQNWINSSFLFPHIETLFTATGEHQGQFARLSVAFLIAGLSLYLGLLASQDRDVPTDALLVTATLLFLSPTGYPWYGIWILAFLPFRPLAGLALLSVLTPLYYARFALGEMGQYDIYTQILTPLQYGLPLLILMLSWVLHRRMAAPTS